MNQPVQIGVHRFLRGRGLGHGGRGRRGTFRGGRCGSRGRRGRSWRERVHQMAARAFRMRVQKFDNLFQTVGDRRHGEIEEVRARDGNVRDGFVNLEELQPRVGELLAQVRDEVQREAREILDDAPRDGAQRRGQNRAGRRAVHLPTLDGLQQRGQMHFAEVLFDLGERREFFWLGHVEAREAGREALVLEPFFHHDFVLHDFHAGLEGVERHPAKTLGVQRAQLFLVTVKIRRAENHAAHAALRDERVIALRRLTGRAFRRVERAEMFVERVANDVGLGEPQRVVEVEDHERLHRLAIGFLRRRKTDHVTLGFLQHQRGDLEHRIRAARKFDLFHERLDAARLGEKFHFEFRQFHLRLARFLGATVTLPTITAAARPAARFAATAGARTGATTAGILRAARTTTTATTRSTATKTAAATAAAAAKSTAPTTARAAPARPAVTLAALAPMAFLASDVLEAAGVHRLRRPIGQEKIFQIELGLWSCTHAACSGFGRCVQSTKIRFGHCRARLGNASAASHDFVSR